MTDEPPTGTLLVVSQDPEVEEEVRFGAPEGLEVVSVNDGASANETLLTLSPLAVIMDLRSGSSGGFSLAMDMSQTPRLARIPLIVLLEREQDRWLAMKAGATAILRKPLNSNELWQAVSSVLAA
jgi:DNA-binding response OmpR family regulator